MRIECIPLAGSSDFDLILQLAVTTNTITSNIIKINIIISTITITNTIINTITSTIININTINDKTKT